jgi:hypothetical protein
LQGRCRSGAAHLNRLGSATYAFDMNQRFQRLAFIS